MSTNDPHDGQPRDSWGRYAPSGAGKSKATPQRDPNARPVHSTGGRDVVLTSGRTPTWQVWQGEELLHERPATKAWQREQREVIALAEGLPRDTSNYIGLSEASKNSVINSIIRGRAAAQRVAPEPGRGQERALTDVTAENLRATNPTLSVEEARRRAQQLAELTSDVPTAIAQERVRFNERDQLDEDAARDAERYE